MKDKTSPHRFRKRGHNYELVHRRNENTVSLPDFPLQIRIKPTAHQQYCFVCRKHVVKGQVQALLNSGLWLASQDHEFHSIQVKPKLSIPSTLRVYPRKIYLHINCLSCLLKKMFAMARVPLAPNCDECEQRFKCYTSNMEIGGSYPYIPSRPCPIRGDEEI